MKKLLIILLAFLALTACRPRGVLSSRQMEDIFVDIHTAEGIIQAAGYNYGHNEAVRGYYQVVLEEHGVSQAQFDSSLVWYTANPTIFDKIYPKVVERMQANLDAFMAQYKRHLQRPKNNVDTWLNICQYGLDRQYWPKKYEKSHTKFVYVKK